MKSFRFALMLSLVMSAATAQAAKVQVYGTGCDPIVFGETPAALGTSVYDATTAFLASKKTDFVPNDANNYFNSIAGLSAHSEKVDGTSMSKLWGWTAKLDGYTFKDSATDTKINDDAAENGPSTIVWSYGYLLIDNSNPDACATEDCWKNARPDDCGGN
jgi:hypothetical protein